MSSLTWMHINEYIFIFSEQFKSKKGNERVFSIIEKPIG